MTTIKFIQFTCEEVVSTGLKEDGTHGKKNSWYAKLEKKATRTRPLKIITMTTIIMKLCATPQTQKRKTSQVYSDRQNQQYHCVWFWR